MKNRKGLSGVEGGKGICYQWKEKGQCFQGDRCSFRHEAQDRAQKPEHAAATPPEPALSRGRSVSKKRSIRGKSNHASTLRHPCRYYLKGPCTRTPCEYWHPPSAKFYKTKRVVSQETRVCFLTFKVDEQPHKRPKKGYFPKRRESEDKGAVAVVKSVSQFGCVSQDSDALVSQGRIEFRGSPMRDVLGPIQRVRFTKSALRHASIPDKKGPSIGQIQVKPRHQRSLYAIKFEDRSHEETERQQRRARSKTWDLAKDILKLKANDKATFFSLAEKWFLPSVSPKEPEEREWLIPERVCTWSVRKTLTRQSWSP